MKKQRPGKPGANDSTNGKDLAEQARREPDLPKGLEPLRLLSLREAAGVLHVCERTVQRLCHDGCLSYVKVGQSMRFEQSALQAYIDSHRSEQIRP